VGQRNFEFQGLPFAGKEVEILANIMPNTTRLVDAAFGRDRVLPTMNDYSIVHFATHAAFVPGKPEGSFIVFGDGSYATLRDIENWSLPNVDLVVLSACETGVGGLGNGEEILGLGYQFQRAGARAAIASLWAVDDGGTQVLMNAFYTALQQPGITKVAALRQAQLALITGDESAIDKTTPARGLGVVAGENSSAVRQNNSSFAHPYYWAPFILIGNGL
jgi:CHAT domain-containing protein